MIDYLTIKALHIIFMVTWFAGLFYIPRLFIYQTEALSKPEPDKTIIFDQLSIMARRLWYIITWPSAVLTFIFGPWLLVVQPGWLSQPFMHVKLSFVLALLLYHLTLHRIFSMLQKGIARYSSTTLRLINEVATIILIAVVFLIVKKDSISWIWGTLTILVIAVGLMIAVRLYKKFREKSYE